MSDLSSIGMATAFLAGLVSFLSPCVLPLVPGYVSYIAGQSLQGAVARGRITNRLSALTLGLIFVAGFATVFVVLGASATALGQWVLKYRYEANILAGILITGFGVFMLGGMSRVAWLHRDIRFHPRVRGGHPLTVYVLGIAFGFGWTPCIGPVLGAILTVSAMSAVPADGVSLLIIYSAGLGVPFLASAAFTDVLIRHLRTLRHLGRPLQAIAGGVMIVMGIAIMTGQITSFALWLLRTFPFFGGIG